MSNKIVIVLLLTAIAAVFYFSWLSDPSFSNESYLPRWILNWSNKYYNLRTAVPFVAVGFLLQVITDYKSSNSIKYNKNLKFIQNIGVVTLIVSIAEAGQLMIQRRNPDLMDVFYGVLGGIVGGLVYNLLKRFKNAE